MSKLVMDAAQCKLAIDLVNSHGGNIAAAGRSIGIPRTTMLHRYRVAMGSRETVATPIVKGSVIATPRAEWGLPPAGLVARYIFTCAQNNTHLFSSAWENIKALAEFYDARICVSTFTYDKASYGRQSVKRGQTAGVEAEGLWYDPEIEEYVLDESVVVAPGLVWCGEMNILPTAVRPLSGFESYTGRKSGIFPHVKFAMESVASGKHEGTKFNYTTGTITQRNYIAKKAGLKAQFHHGYGALLVEVDSYGNWFCRQLNADSDGVIYDLALCAKDGVVTGNHRAEAITWGDIHVGTVSPETQRMNWGEDGILDYLRPKYQFMHDALDFQSRNHHHARDPHTNFKKFCERKDSVSRELVDVALFLAKSSRDWCRTIVVDSNHDGALQRWLREGDYRTDPANALFFLRAQTRLYEAIEARDSNFHLFEWTMRNLVNTASNLNVEFLRPDQSFIICEDANGGIEGGMHGHLGPNGTRPTLQAFARMGRKSNTGHGHAAGIDGGAYRTGITGDLDQGYNVGPSSWSRSHIVTYKNGKRAIFTSWGEKWKA